MMKSIFTLVVLVAMGTAVQADIVSQPYIAGQFNGWDPGAIQMTDLGDGLWGYTITGRTEGSFEGFKITDGTWSNTVPGSDSWYYAPASGEITITYNTNVVLDNWLPEQFRLGISTDPGNWGLVGNFNGWNNNDSAQAMTSLGGGIYAITQTFGAGSWEVKAVVPGTWNAIGTGSGGREQNAPNLTFTLAAPTEVTVYIDAYNNLIGTIGTGNDIDLAFLGKAYAPDPADGQVVGSSLTTLNWSNPDPNNPADAITCDIYFLDAGTSPLIEDPNMGPEVTDSAVVKIADDLAAETLDLNDALVTVLPLAEDHYYYWAVHCTDPHGDPNGNPVTNQGDTWTFFTGDAAPVPSKPVDQYMWLSQDDSAIPGGDGPSNVRYFQVTASYTDDGKSPIVDANLVNLNWDWANGDLGIVEVSEVHDTENQTVTAVYRTIYEEDGNPDNTTVLPGYWEIRLEVTDGSGTAYGTAGIHRVFETCGEAAYADPEDLYNGYYDTNSDCIVNIEDFADFAEAWLSQSVKYE